MAKYLKKVVAPSSVMRRRRRIFKTPRLARLKQSAEPKWQEVKVARLVRFEAKPGKEKELASCLRAGLARVQQEPATASWFAIRFGPSTFAIFDACAEEDASSPSGGFTRGSTRSEICRTTGSAAGDRKGRRAGGQVGRLQLNK